MPYICLLYTSAGGICTECEKIRILIEDLNLTSKLQYGAQPLRRRPTQAGPFLRRVVAAFCENPLAARCTLDCSITPAVETAILHADAALLTRALENVLQNAVRHNAGPITLAFHADHFQLRKETAKLNPELWLGR